MALNIKCLFGHKWRELPWFKSRVGSDDNWTNPKKICLRCFKTRRPRHVLRVNSIEGPGWRYYLPPHWEGQTPPVGYPSWTEYRERINAAMDDLRRNAR